MCGIAGKVSGREAVDPELVGRMCEAVRHRGPDGGGTWVVGPVGLGMVRLAVIDPIGAQQPMTNEDGTVVLVLNGEIVNHHELRAELRGRGHSFRSRGDAEVVVHLYEELGERCVERLRGFFAFALWDLRTGELLLGRDRIGKKPLLFAHRDDTLWFGSEPRAILQDPAVPRDVDLRALDAFLVNQYVPHHLSAFSALTKLPPASTLRWTPGSAPRISRYWELDRPAVPAHVSPQEAAERVRAALLEATRLRLDSDVPLGAFLSGGVDSSAVVAAMAHASTDPVQTFSIRFADDGFDESHWARLVAEHLGTDHHELEVGAVDAGLLPRLAWHCGEPFADPAALPTFVLAQLTRRHVTVALNGDGGDEGFGGYGRYRQLAATRPAERVPIAARRALAAALARAAGTTDGRRALPRAARLARRLALDPAARYADLMRFLSASDRERLYSDTMRERVAGGDPLAHVRRAWDAHPGLPWRQRAMAVDMDTYLADDLVAKVDWTSMASGLEVRSPLLDHELLQLAATLPLGDDKALLKDAVAPWLPAGVLTREKQGFAVPIGRWLREELRSLPEDVLLDPVARRRDLFDEREVRRMIAEHRGGADRSEALWAMVSLELWFLTCVDTPTAQAHELPVLA
jgi:asparagine synthase (glutamine-hydrolysing)